MDIDLRFDRGHFHHLAGFQYLRDIDFIRTAEREAVFLAVLEERITMALLEKSPNFQKISPRLTVLNNLENYLDSDQLIFRYLEEKSFSKSKPTIFWRIILTTPCLTSLLQKTIIALWGSLCLRKVLRIIQKECPSTQSLKKRKSS